VLDVLGAQTQVRTCPSPYVLGHRGVQDPSSRTEAILGAVSLAIFSPRSHTLSQEPHPRSYFLSQKPPLPKFLYTRAGTFIKVVR
jgi:hypothetical protein